MVKYSQYIGPGKKNVISPEWADETIASFKTEEYTMDFDGAVTKSIYREIAEGCCIPKDQPEWFTAGAKTNPDHWKEDYLWYGDVRLVKDTLTLASGEVKTHYYICRGDNAKMLRPANMSEHAC